MSDLPSLNRERLTITASQVGVEVNIVWVGNSDDHDPAEYMGPYLQNLATQLSGRRTRIDFRQLDFMNSSTIKQIVRFVQVLATKVPSVTLQYNDQQRWQALSFQALRTVFLPLRNVTVTA